MITLHSLRQKFAVTAMLAMAALPASAIEVVTSVKPLQLVAAAITDGITEPEVLVPANASPHHYVLKPSDMRKLMAADLVLWVGPDMEVAMAKPISRTEAVKVQLLEDSGEDHSGHDHGEHHHETDPHIWMDPAQMLTAAETLATELEKLLPEQQERLQQNYQQFAMQVVRLDREMQQQMAVLQGKGFFTFHDAYQRLFDRYGLNQLGYFTVDPGRKPGARKLNEIRQALKQKKAVCVFSEPQFEDKIISAVVKDPEIRIGELDPLAREVAVTAQGYPEFIRGLGNQISACLIGKS